MQLCMKTYDYKDESRDVKGKVRYLALLTNFMIDWKTQCYSRTLINAPRLEECHNFNYS